MTRDEILRAVIKLYAGDGEEEANIELANRLLQELPNSKIIDLIFQDFRELTPEEVVDEAMQQEADHASRS